MVRRVEHHRLRPHLLLRPRDEGAVARGAGPGVQRPDAHARRVPAQVCGPQLPQVRAQAEGRGHAALV